jgi:hypothetical protein
MDNTVKHGEYDLYSRYGKYGSTMIMVDMVNDGQGLVSYGDWWVKGLQLGD